MREPLLIPAQLFLSAPRWVEPCECWLPWTEHDVLSVGSRADEPPTNNLALTTLHRTAQSLWFNCLLYVLVPGFPDQDLCYAGDVQWEALGMKTLSALRGVPLGRCALPWRNLVFQSELKFSLPWGALLTIYPTSVQVWGRKFVEQPWTDDFLGYLHKSVCVCGGGKPWKKTCLTWLNVQT